MLVLSHTASSAIPLRLTWTWQLTTEKLLLSILQWVQPHVLVVTLLLHHGIGEALKLAVIVVPRLTWQLTRKCIYNRVIQHKPLRAAHKWTRFLAWLSIISVSFTTFRAFSNELFERGGNFNFSIKLVLLLFFKISAENLLLLPFVGPNLA